MVALEDMAKQSGQNLAIFQQELGKELFITCSFEFPIRSLDSTQFVSCYSRKNQCWLLGPEMFRRSPLNNSTMLSQVLASAPSERLKAYQEAGYRHCDTDHAVVVKCK